MRLSSALSPPVMEALQSRYGADKEKASVHSGLLFSIFSKGLARAVSGSGDTCGTCIHTLLF